MVLVAAVFVVATAEVILILRTFALSGSNRFLLAILLVLFTSSTITAFVIIAKVTISLEYGPSHIPSIRQCIPTILKNTPLPVGSIGFSLVLAFEVLILVITLIIGIRRFRNTRSQLVVSLYTDGVFYFAFIALFSSANIVLSRTGPYELIESLSVLQTVMHSILACRILLHVRRDGSLSYLEEFELGSFSALWFRDSIRVHT